MIDWNYVTRMRDEIGEESFAEIVALCVAEAGRSIERLQAGTTQGTIADELHNLRGSVLNAGFIELAALCKKYEDNAHFCDDFSDLVECFARSRSLFKV